MSDPATCLHNVVAPYSPDNVRCLSCGTEITKEMWDAKGYEYNVDYNVWVHVSKRGDYVKLRGRGK